MKIPTKFSLLNSLLFSSLALLSCSKVTVHKNAAASSDQTSSKQPERNSLMGVNLDGLSDWSPAQVFVDAAKTARAFGSYAAWYDGAATLDADGWPNSDFGMTVMTGMPNPIDGIYTISFVGQADLHPVSGSNWILKSQNYDAASNTTTAQIDLQAGQQSLGFRFENTIVGVKDIHIIRPGYDPIHPPTFTKEFLAAVAPFSTLRLMDYLASNGGGFSGGVNPVIHWADRCEPNSPLYTSRKGGPLEPMIELANIQNKSLWINVPINAADDYITNLALLFKTSFKSSGSIYIEYSNEVWNYAFPQQKANLDAAVAEVAAGDHTLDLGGTDSNQVYWAWRRTAARLAHIAAIFRTVMGDDPRIKPVLAAQAAQPTILASQLQYLERYVGPPNKILAAVAIAPYLTPSSSANMQSATLTIDQLIAGLFESTAKSSQNSAVLQHHALAASYGLKSMAYEGGEDLGQYDISVPTKIAAQQDPRIGTAVGDYLTEWWQGGGDLFMYFNLVSTHSKWGYWGLTNNISDLSQPKISAAMELTKHAVPALDPALIPLAPTSFMADQFKFHTGINNTAANNGVVSYTGAGNSFIYLVRSDDDGLYNIEIQVSPPSGNTQFQFSTRVAGHVSPIVTLSAPPSPAPSFVSVALGPVSLKKGMNAVAVNFVAGGMSFKSLSISR